MPRPRPTRGPVNFEPADEARLLALGMLGRCDSTGRVFSVGNVTVTGRYMDCSVFTCPSCKRPHDDRPLWGGDPDARQGYHVLREPVVHEDAYGVTATGHVIGTRW